MDDKLKMLVGILVPLLGLAAMWGAFRQRVFAQRRDHDELEE